METFWQTIQFIVIAIAWIIVIHLAKTGEKELAKREEDNKTIKVANYTAEEVLEPTDKKSLAFTYVEPEVQTPEVKKQKGGFVSKELLRSYLAKRIAKD